MHPDCHDWEVIWDDNISVRCCVCTICGIEKIFQYDPEEEMKAQVDAIVLRTRNQDVMEYEDIDTLTRYIDLLHYKQNARLRKGMSPLDDGRNFVL